MCVGFLAAAIFYFIAARTSKLKCTFLSCSICRSAQECSGVKLSPCSQVLLSCSQCTNSQTLVNHRMDLYGFILYNSCLFLLIFIGCLISIDIRYVGQSQTLHCCFAWPGLLSIFLMRLQATVGNTSSCCRCTGARGT